MKKMKAVLILISFLSLGLNCYQQQTLTLLDNVNMKFYNNGTHTDFKVMSSLGRNIFILNAWLGIGLNSNSSMVIH